MIGDGAQGPAGIGVRAAFKATSRCHGKRSAVGARADDLRSIHPDDAAEWAIRLIELDEDVGALDGCLYELVEAISLAEIQPEEFDGPVYRRQDFENWLRRYRECVQSNTASSGA
ncbi:hypothetical protein [Cellulomonas phragmiteti]|uniref:CdiI immunity protein domain-containing protein n=1 Tax=Cellulomonas phragmiteti TaxID=478780 RepID=A0ABQ4DQK0_9CELL|nr:hypothetical protein [Cellulomonas phragmiteti]GIG41257.1 hypothetical protein Cph01nite_30190 [Cellulomonas phragmiteti]